LFCTGTLVSLLLHCVTQLPFRGITKAMNTHNLDRRVPLTSWNVRLNGHWELRGRCAPMPVNLFCSSTSQRSYMTLRLKYRDVDDPL
jgi:hypothetical protein